MGDDNPAWHRQTQTAKETAVQEDKTLHAIAQFNVPANDNNNEVYTTNNSGGDFYLELVTFAITANYTDNANAQVQVRNENDFVLVPFDGNPQNFPIPFDPAVTVPDGGDIRLVVENNSSNMISVRSVVFLREP